MSTGDNYLMVNQLFQKNLNTIFITNIKKLTNFLEKIKDSTDAPKH